jgi:MFS superfamily sulfate permease-like transporter
MDFLFSSLSDLYKGIFIGVSTSAVVFVAAIVWLKIGSKGRADSRVPLLSPEDEEEEEDQCEVHRILHSNLFVFEK